MQALQQKRVELILQQLEELPTLPAVALQLLRMTGDEESSARDVVEILSSDPSLTAAILKMVRRADLGTPQEISSVERAVMLLGFDAVRHAALAASVFQCFGVATQAGRFDREQFWKHSVAVASGAELLADEIKKSGRRAAFNPGEAFICGLLHDIGKVALDAALPKSFARVIEAAELLRGDVADIERQVIGADHLVAGKRLAERWELPQIISEAIWLHGQRPSALPTTVANAPLINLITLADILARQQHLGFSGNYSFPIPVAELLEAVGATAQQLEQVRSRLVGHMQRRIEALGLGQPDSGQLYQEALANANRQLGHAARRLEETNKRLSVRARFFDALAAFHQDLRPDAPAQQVLTAIGQTAIGILQTAACCAFSLPPGRQWAEAVLMDDTGRILDTILVDLPPESVPQTAAQSSQAGEPVGAVDAAWDASLDPASGPILVAGEELEWLLAVVSPRLQNEQRYWIALRCEGRCIGGVLWGGANGDSQRQGAQARELSAMATGWSLALRTSQIREESRLLSEQLAQANRQLHGAQNEITQARAMAGVGEMAAGAAHEMNNPLAIISGRSQLLESQLEDPAQKHAARQIHEQSHRLSRIITELMEFARPQSPKIATVDTVELIERSVHELKQEQDGEPRTIELTLGELPAVSIDAHQVGAALREIIRNAMHATDEKGRVVLHGAVDPTGDRVVIQVIDDGCGMDEATLHHAFDPFYSHRPAGRSRGMGLAKALRWVESSGGTIRLESHVGHGTRAMMLLPMARPSSEAPAQMRKAAR